MPPQAAAGSSPTPPAGMLQISQLDADSASRQQALAQLTVGIREAAQLLAAQPSFKAAARLGQLRAQLADLEVRPLPVQAGRHYSDTHICIQDPKLLALDRHTQLLDCLPGAPADGQAATH